MALRWTPEQVDRLERAIRDGLRIALTRRGSEHVVIAVRLGSVRGRDAVVGRVAMTGEEMTFLLDEVEGFEILPA